MHPFGNDKSNLFRNSIGIIESRISLSQGIYNSTLDRYLRYDEELIVPIIENTPFEKDLEERMNETMQKYPGSTAILVRRHGIYVWGETWEKAKTQWVISIIAALRFDDNLIIIFSQ